MMAQMCKRMIEREGETVRTNVCTGKRRVQIQSFFFIWYDGERKEVFIRGISGGGFGHQTSDITGPGKKISSHACSLLSIREADACRKPGAMTSPAAQCRGGSPLGVSVRLKLGWSRVGLAHPWGPLAVIHMHTDVRGHSYKRSVFLATSLLSFLS